MRRAGWLGLLLCACGGVARPTADPGPSARQGEAQAAIEFDASASSGQISAWDWDFGDGQGASGVKVSHTYAKAGDYSALLTVRGPGGIDSASVLVTIGAGCTAKAGIGVLTADPQPGAPVQLSSAGSAGCNGAPLVDYQWDFGDGVLESGAAKTSVQHTYALKGSYTVSLKVVDQGGREGRATRALGVGVITAKPIVQCQASAQATVGRAATFTASGSDPGGGAIASYSWVFSDDGSWATGSTVQHTFATTGQFSATVTAKTGDDRSSEACTTAVTVSLPPSYAGNWMFVPAAAPMTGCSQFQVAFPASAMTLTQAGTTLTAIPSGNGWPAGVSLSGSEEPSPAAPGTFRLTGQLPNESKAPCGSVVPEHSLQLSFSSPLKVSGTWRIVYTAPCVGTGCSGLCNCVAQGTFTADKV